MKAKKQKVEIYMDLEDAANDMINHIDKGWSVYICTTLYSVITHKVLVVYERELETWN